MFINDHLRGAFTDPVFLMFLRIGPRTILVPGELNGYQKAWETYGRVPWRDLFQPTIQMAREGWNVSESMSVSIKTGLSYIKTDPGLRSGGGYCLVSY